MDKGGYFKIAPRTPHKKSRRYLPGTNVLETTFETETGIATLTDFMTIHHHGAPDQPREVGDDHEVMRILECKSGSVDFLMECFPRFEYGTIVPHAHLDTPNTAFAHGGANAVSLYCSSPMTQLDDGYVSQGTLVDRGRWRSGLPALRSLLQSLGHPARGERALVGRGPR